eukprot:Clim_evm20s241 gene=Clim_evmTU20s241
MRPQIAWKLQEFMAHTEPVNCMTLGPKSGKIMATGGEDKKVKIWTLNKPEPLLSLTGHSNPVVCVAFDTAEELTLAGSWSGTLRLWELETSKVLRTLPGHKASIGSVVFHPYGDFFASGSDDAQLKVWDIRRKGCIQTYRGHDGPITSLQFSPDGRWVISASEDHTMRLWDLTAGKVLTVFQEHTGPVTSIRFHPVEFLLGSASADRTVKLWDLETFACIGSSDGESHGVDCLTFHPSGSAAMAASRDALRTYGWEPSVTFDAVHVPWAGVKDMTVLNGQAVGVACQREVATVWVVDLNRVKPFGTSGEAVDEAEEQRTRAEADPRVPTGDMVSELSIHGAEVPQTAQASSTRTATITIPIRRYSFAEEDSVDGDNNAASVKVSDAFSQEQVKYTDGRPRTSQFDTAAPRYPRPPGLSPERCGTRPIGCSTTAVNLPQSSDGVVAAGLGDTYTHDVDVGSTGNFPSNSKLNRTPTEAELMRELAGARASLEERREKASDETESPASGNKDHKMGKGNSTDGRTGKEADVGTSQAPGLSPTTVAAASKHSFQDSTKENASASTVPSNRISAPGPFSPPRTLAGSSLMDDYSVAHPGDVVPADRHTPIGLAVDDFMPKPGQMSYDAVQETVDLSALDMTGLELQLAQTPKMLQVMQQRLRNVSAVRLLWAEGRTREAVELLADMNDIGTAVDVLNILNLKKSAWNLDIVTLVLPLAQDLLESQFASHLTTACGSIKLVLRSFGQLIKDMLPQAISAASAAKSPAGMDIAREERAKKCMFCYERLLSCRQLLESLRSLDGRIGGVIRETLRAYDLTF